MNDILTANSIFCPIDGTRMQNLRHDWLFVCPQCRLQASSLLPNISSGELGGEIDEQSREIGLNSVRIANGGRLLDAIQEEIGPGTLLDVGSGPGFFISLARERGFDVSGIEPDPNMASACARRGLPVYQGFFPEAAPNKAFDVIILNDVLEHIPDLRSVFAGFRKHLASGGLLVLNCPNRLGTFYWLASLLDRFGFGRALKRMWQVGLPSPHVWYFAPAQLRELGEKEGFAFVKTVQLETLSRDGLYDRIAYVRGQRTLFNLMVFAVIWCSLPIFRLLPSDLGVVVLRKP
jgi:SAM-dependent methyltransferase